ncbi:MAG TPA: biotin transporter BioY [Microvirga sp.]|jgi:biotin transport system substrate-specific component|nr:biotin transporter BioY [Microvirga sp.]
MSTGVAPVAAPSTLMSLVWPSRSSLRAAVLMLVGSALLAISAKIQVPFYPVPMTMQTLVVLVIGAAYGWRLGGATLALYLAEGALGLPVFAGPVAGVGYMAGPTGGYLAGFLAAAVLTGVMAERGWDRSLLRVLVMMTVGHAVIFVFGVAWLAYLFQFDVARAWAAGVAPFYAATVLKTALAAALMQVAWTVAARRSEARE